MTSSEVLEELPWQQHQLAPQEPGTTGGRAPLEERDESSKKTENAALECITLLLQETMFYMWNMIFKNKNRAMISQ